MNAIKVVSGIVSALVIIFEFNDVVELLKNQRKLIAKGVWDSAEITRNITKDFVAIFLVLFLYFMFLKLTKEK